MEKQIKMVNEFHQKFKQSQSDAPALLSNKESLLRYVLEIGRAHV
jgi:hypothetical protein